MDCFYIFNCYCIVINSNVGIFKIGVIKSGIVHAGINIIGSFNFIIKQIKVLIEFVCEHLHIFFGKL